MMGLALVRQFRDWWRGWSDDDLSSINAKLARGVHCPVSERESRAWLAQVWAEERQKRNMSRS